MWWGLSGAWSASFFFGHTEQHTELSLPGLEPTPSAVEAQSAGPPGKSLVSVLKWRLRFTLVKFASCLSLLAHQGSPTLAFFSFPKSYHEHDCNAQDNLA